MEEESNAAAAEVIVETNSSTKNGNNLSILNDTLTEDTSINDEEKVDFGQSSESDEDGVFVTIGDIKTDLPPPRNLHEFSQQYKPPSRLVTNYPTMEEIQKKLEAAMHEKQPHVERQKSTHELKNPYWKRNKLLHDKRARSQFAASDGHHVIPLNDSDGDGDLVIIDVDVHTQVTVKNRVIINESAAEKLPRLIRDIVTTVAKNDLDSLDAVKIPTVNLSSSAAALKSTTNVTKSVSTFHVSQPSTSSLSSQSTTNISLPPEYNPRVPPPNFSTATKANNDPIFTIHDLLRQYSDDGSSNSEVKPSFPDQKVREQHQRNIDRNRWRETSRANDGYRRPLQFFNSSSSNVRIQSSRSRSPLQMANHQDYVKNRNNSHSKPNFSKSAAFFD